MVDKAADEDELMLVAADAGAEDIDDQGDTWQVTTPPTELHAVAHRDRGGRHHGEVARPHDDPDHHVALDEESKAKSVLRLMDALEEHDDVEAVYANFDIPDAVSRQSRA